MTQSETQPNEVTLSEMFAQASAGGPPQAAPQHSSGGQQRPSGRRTGVIVGAVAFGVVALGALGWYAATHTAPGTHIAGVDVGGQTQGQVADTLQARLSSATVALQQGGESVELRGQDVAATLDTSALAQQSLEQSPWWNPTRWNQSIDAGAAAVPTVDPAKVQEFAQQAWPDATKASQDASIEYSSAHSGFQVTPGVDGQSIDRDKVVESLQQALAEPSGASTVDVELTPQAPAISTESAQQKADALNAQIGDVAFMIGEDKAVPVSPDIAASWVKVVPNPAAGTIDSSFDEQAVADFVGTLPSKVDRQMKPETVLVDNAGAQIATLVAGQSGRTLSGTDGIAADFTQKLNQGESHYTLSNVTEVPAEQTKINRRVEVNLTTMHTYLYENDQVVGDFLVSPGIEATGHGTDPGDFKVRAKVTSQTMRGFNGDGSRYETPNVKWVSYYNGDEAFHGTYWHNQFGKKQMSHGCVNMTEADAKTVFDFVRVGVDVNVHH